MKKTLINAVVLATAATLANAGTLDVTTASKVTANPDNTGAIDLTTEGTSDWAFWGPATNPAAFAKTDQKLVATNSITVTELGTFSKFQDTTGGWDFDWTDGTVNAAGSGNPGLQALKGSGGEVGEGFRFEVAADTTVQTLKLYLGEWQADGVLNVSLSDGSAAAVTGFDEGDTTGPRWIVIQIDFAADSAGQTLTADWVFDDTGDAGVFFNNNNDNIFIGAATLAEVFPFKLEVVAYDSGTGMLSVTADDIPVGPTYHLEQATDLQSFGILTPNFDFDSTTTQPFQIPVDPSTEPALFLRAHNGPSIP